MAVPPTAPVETADGILPPVPDVTVEFNKAVYCASDSADSDDTDDIFPMDWSDEEHPDNVSHDVSFGYVSPPKAVLSLFTFTMVTVLCTTKVPQVPTGRPTILLLVWNK